MISKHNRSAIIVGKHNGEIIRRYVQLLKEGRNYYTITIGNYLTSKEFDKQVKDGTYSYDETLFRIVENKTKLAIEDYNLFVRQLKKDILYIPCVWILDD